jgi:hypothetical protein
VDALKARSGATPAPYRCRWYPSPGVKTGVGELHPMKYELPSLVVMFQRGAPAPQWEPRGPAGVSAPGLRRSQPSSEIAFP